MSEMTWMKALGNLQKTARYDGRKKQWEPDPEKFNQKPSQSLEERLSVPAKEKMPTFDPVPPREIYKDPDLPEPKKRAFGIKA